MTLLQATADTFWKWDVGQASTMGTLILSAYLVLRNANRQHGENKEKIEAVLKWRDQHESEARDAKEQITQLRVIAGEMRAIADSMKDQMQFFRQELLEIRREQQRRDRAS